MVERIIHFKVGNGSCSVIEGEDFVMIVDLNKTEDKDSSYDLLEPYFRDLNGKKHIDVLCVTHGDEDHCLGFSQFKKMLDEHELTIGTIWHQDYDRRKKPGAEDLPEDYLALQEEIDRRKSISSPLEGNLQVALKSTYDEQTAFEGINKPDNLTLKVLSPFKEDNEDSEYDHNDLSLIINVCINEFNILYTGDVSSRYWQERIFPDLLNQYEYQDWAKAHILELGHHGSYDFFGNDRESVRDSEDEPDNYDALNKISPEFYILSAASRFPTSGDSSGDEPPHYAGWKWYHKWLQDNRGVDKDDKHPDLIKYTCDGDIKIELDGTTWEWDLDYDHNEKSRKRVRKEALKVKSLLSSGGLVVGSSLKAKAHKGYYGWSI